MAHAELRFVDGLFWKTLAIGIVAVLIAWPVASWHVAWSVALGMAISAANMRVVALVSRKMVNVAQTGSTGSTKWTVVLLVKLLLLFVLTYLVIIRLGAHVIGFVVGFSAFLPAAAWQSVVYLREIQEQVTDTEQSSEPPEQHNERF